MLRWSWFVLFAFVPVAWGAPVTPGKERFVILELQPMPAPVPALKYQLLPELAEMQPGNALPMYLKCFCEQNNFFYNKEVVAERERLIACPLADIKKGSLKGYGGSATRNADYAARMEFIDWNLLPKIREDGFHLLLPDLQQMRSLANAMLVRCRGEIVDGDFDGALRSIKTLFSLSRHMGEHPTLIGGLVGMAIANLGCNLLEELIQQPNAPNLYWALATAPAPFVDLRKAMSGERMILESSFGTLVNGKKVWGKDDIEEAQKRMEDIAQVIDFDRDRSKEAHAWLGERLKDQEWLKIARKMLVENGYPADKVKDYPPEQVLLYRLLVKSKIHRDETLKYMSFPYWQVQALLEETTKKPEPIEERICHSLGFSGTQTKTAQVRTDQRLAAYRVIEAIRLHGASNGGKLPDKLEELTAILPVDPASGKAFEYKRDGQTAILSGVPIKSGSSTLQSRYELRLRK